MFSVIFKNQDLRKTQIFERLILNLVFWLCLRLTDKSVATEMNPGSPRFRRGHQTTPAMKHALHRPIWCRKIDCLETGYVPASTAAMLVTFTAILFFSLGQMFPAHFPPDFGPITVPEGNVSILDSSPTAGSQVQNMSVDSAGIDNRFIEKGADLGKDSDNPATEETNSVATVGSDAESEGSKPEQETEEEAVKIMEDSGGSEDLVGRHQKGEKVEIIKFEILVDFE